MNLAWDEVVVSDTLQFLLMIQLMIARDTVVEKLCDALPNARRVKTHSFEFSGNVFELWRNPDFDEEMLDDSEVGYFFYEGRLEATPIGETSEALQVEVARQVSSELIRRGIKVVICANFEDKI